MARFDLVSKMKPRGDQPRAIAQLTERILEGERYSTLLGVTGSGKTFTMAHVIANVQKPTLVISHNKTLAAQLYAEFKEFFPNNTVHYFVSYYDFYTPEAYIPARDIYIEKDASINDDLDRLRLAATSALMSRRDVIIVASVSCIYNLGSPEDYTRMIITLRRGDTFDRTAFFRALVDLQYTRAHADFARGSFRVRGDTLDIFPSYQETALRLTLDGNTLVRLATIHPVSGKILVEHRDFTLYPAKHFLLPQDKIACATPTILAELEERVAYFKREGKLLEAQRLDARTRYDVELLQEIGTCKGIENYSRHLSGRPLGSRPYTLLDYFLKERSTGNKEQGTYSSSSFLCFVDESHATLPQLHGMYNGDHSRKQTLVEYGFRLPSALDNRPLRFDEWEALIPQAIFVSATPGPYELAKCEGKVIEQVIRPTGLVDPQIHVEPAINQVPHLVEEIKKRVAMKERVLVTTLTKRLAEDLSQYLDELHLKGRYLHSEIETIERVQILRELREGKFDVLVGVNLLREGLDLPEVTLVAILDADKEGFLRSATSIIQTIGRTARNVNGEVILYADTLTDSMQKAIAESERRRKIQLEYNAKHHITPRTIEKEIRRGIEEIVSAERATRDAVRLDEDAFDRTERIAILERDMLSAAERLDFERAAELRDRIRALDGAEPATALARGSRRRKERLTRHFVSKHSSPTT